MEKLENGNNVLACTRRSPTARPQAGVLTEPRSVGCINFGFDDQRLYVRAFASSLRMRVRVT